MPTLASTSSVSVYLAKEASFGVAATTQPYLMRITGESLNFGVTKNPSKEMNATRTVPSVIPVTASASGGFTAEMSYRTFDLLLESVMQSVYTVFGTLGVGVATATTSISATVITATAPTTGTSDWSTLQRGQWFKVKSAGANADKLLKISSTVTPTASVITLDAATPAVVSAGESIQVETSRLTHGTTQTSFTIERNSTDISGGAFMTYVGMTPSKMGLKIASGAFSELTFDFMGRSATMTTSTGMSGGAPIAYTTQDFDIHSGVSGVNIPSTLWINGAPVTSTYVKSLDFSFDNTLRSQEAIGILGSASVGSGTIQCMINMSIYFADITLYNQFIANLYSVLVFSTTDGAGNGYVFTAPKANLTSYKINASGKDNDLMADLSFTCVRDAANTIPGLRQCLFIDRVGV